MEIKIILNNNFSYVETEDVELLNVLWNALRFREHNYFHKRAYKQKKWDGYKNFFNKSNGKFLSGLLPEVVYGIKTLGKKYKIIDNRKPFVWLYDKIDGNFLGENISLHDYQIDYVNQFLKIKRGIIQAPTSCHAKNDKILMYDGSIKKVQDIVVGDSLMGPDSSPRKVLELHRGTDDIYEIKPFRNKSFFVTSEHILVLKKLKTHLNRSFSEKNEKIIEVKVKDYLKWSNYKKHYHKLIKVSVNFPDKKVPLDPYFLGTLLGDGSLKKQIGVTNIDKEVINEFYLQAKQYNLSVVKSNNSKRVTTYFFKGKKGVTNKIQLILNKLNLRVTCGHKFIPNIYKINSRKKRLQLLAGLIDTDGYVGNRYIEITSKSKKLAEDIVFLCQSLGFHASLNKSYKNCQTNKTKKLYWRVYVSGNISEIPLKLKRKKSKHKLSRNNLNFGFEVKKIGKDEFYGFTLDKDNLYLTDNFFVTHNSGKTFILVSLLKCLPPKTPTLFLTKTVSLVDQNYEEAKQWGIPNIGRVFDKYKEPNIITFANIHTATFKKIERLLPHIKAIFVDEVHECMSKVPTTAYSKMNNASVRCGISATAFKRAGKDKVQKFSVKGYFGPIIKTTDKKIITTKDLQERNILSKSKCVFYYIRQPEGIEYEPFQDAVKLGIADNIYFHQVVERLTKKIKGRTLVITERIAQGQSLVGLLPNADWICGEIKIDERKEIFEKLRKDKECVAVAMQQIVTAGINVFIHNLINAAGGLAEHSIIQRMGRGLRKASDKDCLRYYDFIFTTNDYLLRQSYSRVRTLEKEGHEVEVKEIDF